MKKQITLIFTALSFFTRIPCYSLGNHSPEYLSKSAKYLPLIGWVIGGFGAVMYVLLNAFLPDSIAIILSMASTILLTGAFHEDGFMDSCDGFGGGTAKEKILSIMKDSSVGAYGVIGIVLVLALKYFSLINLHMQLVPAAMIAGHSLSRFIAISFMYTHNYARENDSKISNITGKFNFNDLSIAALLGILPILLLGYQYFLIVIPVLILRFLSGKYYTGRINGYTGDALGAIQQISEVLCYLSILVIAQWKFI